jgi:hypothetical protein
MDDDSTSDDSVQLISNLKTQKSDVYAFGCLYYEVSNKLAILRNPELPRSIMIGYLLPVQRKLKS